MYREKTLPPQGSPLPPWHAYFMNFAQVAKTRGNCLIYQVGAVLVKERQIIATGYNGTPASIKNCLDGGCPRCLKKKKGILQSGQEKGTCLCVHAEINAVLQCAYHGISSQGTVMYTTTSPCMLCAKEILNAGIREVYYAIIDKNEMQSLTLLKKYLKNVAQIV